MSEAEKKKANLQALRDKLKMKKARVTGEEEKKEEEEKEEEVTVRYDFVASGSRDKLVYIWNAQRGDTVMTLAGHDGWVNKVEFHNNGKYLLSASDDKAVWIWDLANNGVPIKMTNIHSMFVTGVAISRKLMASSDAHSRIKIWALR